MPHLGVDAWGSYDEHGNVAPKPQTEDEQRAANERAQVAEVFSLTGGELEETAWVPTYPRTVSDFQYDPRAGAHVWTGRVEATSFTFTYWYQGTPDYSFDEPWNSVPDQTCRTVCEQELYGMAPETVTDDEGTWKVVARYTTSGERECPGQQCDPRGNESDGINREATDCPYCEAAPGEEHGYIYIGDGWAEIVYRLEPQADAETLERVDAAVFALNELVLNDRAKLTDSERVLIDAADLAVNQVQDAIRTRLGFTDSAGNDI
jgi:hypothetical protein